MDNRERQPEPALIPAWARRPAVVLLVCSLAISVIIGVLAAHASHPDAVDRSVDSWVQGHLGTHARVLSLVVDIAEPVQFAIITLVLILACVAVRRLNAAVLVAVSVPAAVILTEFIFKPLVHRTLHGALVYPSGHTCRVFTLATITAVLMLNPPSQRPRPSVRIVIGLAATAVGCAVAVAVIGLNWHYFTDTIGGATLAIGVVLATAFLVDKSGIAERLPGHREAAPEVTPSNRPATLVQEPGKTD